MPTLHAYPNSLRPHIFKTQHKNLAELKVCVNGIVFKQKIKLLGMEAIELNVLVLEFKYFFMSYTKFVLHGSAWTVSGGMSC